MTAGDERVRFGPGSLVPTGINAVAWRLVLEACDRQVPESLNELRAFATAPEMPTDEVLSQWAERWGMPPWAADWEEQWFEGWEERDEKGQLSGKTRRPPPENLQLSLWFMQLVRWHLSRWREYPGTADRWVIASRLAPEHGWTVCWRADGTPDFIYSLQWHPTEESRAAFDARADAYVKTLKASNDTITTPAFSTQDFDAFVLEHVAKLSSADVAEKLAFRRDESSILRRNQQVADLLGLRLRRRPPGRLPQNPTSK